jgi:hypothetical protein
VVRAELVSDSSAARIESPHDVSTQQTGLEFADQRRGDGSCQPPVVEALLMDGNKSSFLATNRLWLLKVAFLLD